MRDMRELRLATIRGIKSVGSDVDGMRVVPLQRRDC